MEELVHDVEPEIGHILRRARQELNLSVADVAQRLHLAVDIIESIESNDFHQSRTPLAFMRGYVRSYAKCVELDADAVVKIFEKITNPQPDIRRKPKEKNQSVPTKRFGSIIFLVLLLGIGVAYVMYPESFQQWLSTAEVETNDTPMSENSGGISQALIPSQTEDGDVVLGDPISEEGFVSEEGEAEGDVAVAEVETPAEEESTVISELKDERSFVKLQFKFANNCWVNVEDATGTVLATGTKRKGYQMDLEGVAPFKIRLGIPNAVSITMNGQDIDLSAYPANRPADIVLDNE